MNILNQTNLICFGAFNGSVEIEGDDTNAPYKYNWLNISNDTLSEQGNLGAGIYPVTITDSKGCLTTDSVIITQPSQFGVNLNITHTPCGSTTGQIIATPFGGTSPYSYFWSSYSDSDSIHSNLASGFDTLYIVDQNNCEIQRLAEVLSSSGFSASAEVLNNVVCFPDSGGSARLSFSGGIPPYTLSYWGNEYLDDTLTNLMPSLYELTIKDSLGCLQKVNFTITGPEQIFANLEILSPSDETSANGHITCHTNGGTPPYSYLWSDSSTTEYIDSISIGEYYVRITDSNGCTMYQDILVRSSPIPCFNCSDVHQDCTPYYSGPSPCNPCLTDVILNIEDFGADGSDLLSDQCAFEEASNYISQLDPDIYKELNIPSGTYYVGYQEQHGNWWLLGSTILCFEDINNLKIQGDYSSPKPIIRYNECMKYGAFSPNEITNTDDRFLSDFPGRIVNGTINGTTVTTTENIAWINPPCSVKVQLIPFRRAEWFLVTQVNNTTEFTLNGAPIQNGSFIITVYTDCHVNPVDYSNIASMGQMFHFNKCHNVTLANLELDGNIDNVIIGGGYYFDGIQVDYDGVFVNACNNLTIEDLDIHHFGHDGIWINYRTDCPTSTPQVNIDMECYIYNTNSRFNGRNAMSWTGGKGLNVFNSDFSYTGQSRLLSHPGSGLDIEYENSNNPNADGYFFNTSFKYNRYHGMICDAAGYQSRTEHITRDFTFERCTFVASEEGDAIWPNSRNFLFADNCEFVGKVWNPYSVATATPTGIYFDNTKFRRCFFYEEYDEIDITAPAEFQGIHYFSHTVEETEVINGVRSIIDVGNSTQPFPTLHQPLIEFSNSTRVLMANCTTETNLTNKLMYLGLGAPTNLAFHNRNILENCFFRSHGMNFIVADANNDPICDNILTSINHVICNGTNQTHWYGPVRPQPTIQNNPCGSTAWQYSFSSGGNVWADFNIGPNDPAVGDFFTGHFVFVPGPLQTKFRDLDDPNTAMPLYSTPCDHLAINFPTQCSQSQRPARMKIENDMSEIICSPNPITSEITLKNMIPGRTVLIVDVLGSLAYERFVESDFEKINLSFLKAGVYFVSQNGLRPAKFIKQ